MFLIVIAGLVLTVLDRTVRVVVDEPVRERVARLITSSWASSYSVTTDINQVSAVGILVLQQTPCGAVSHG